MKKLVNKKNVLKEAGVMLIATILVLTSIFGFTPTTKVSKAVPTTIFFEDFNAAWGTYGNSPPTDWEIHDYGSESPPVWNNNDWHRYYYSTFGSYCARVYYSPYESMNEWLITPEIDCGPYGIVDGLTLSFRQYLYFYSTYPGYGYVEGSIDSGSTFPYIYRIAEYSSTQSTGYYTYPIPWAALEDDVVIRFRYEAPGFQGRYWYIDDVLIETTNNPPTMPHNPSPADYDGITVVSPCTTNGLTFYGGDTDSDNVYYKFFFGTTNPPTEIIWEWTYTGSTTFIPYYGGLDLVSDTMYYWYIEATDDDPVNPQTTIGPVWSFKTEKCEYLDIQEPDIWAEDGKVWAKITNSHPTDNIHADITMTFTVNPDGPCGCSASGLISDDLDEISTDPLIYEIKWLDVNIPHSNCKEVKVKIDGGCACFDVTVTVDSCFRDPDHHCIIQETREGCICDLSIC